MNFCSKVWDECKNISILNTPFSLQARDGVFLNSAKKRTDIWHSEVAFCSEFGGASYDESICFGGGPVVLNSTQDLSSPSGICLEKIGNGSYLNMVAHPDGSNRVFISNQLGKIWLATVPEEGSGEVLAIDESSPFLDLTDKVYFDAEFGMSGLAFHPNYQDNGRFFVSFNCDKFKWPAECSGRCSCNSEVGCKPENLVPENGAHPCQYHSVIAEFTANDTTSQPSLVTVTSAKPQEVRRIFTMGLPFTSQHGGQILFGPEDGYLYFMMGYGGSRGDPYNFSQNKKCLLEKIMRLDVDNMPSAAEIAALGLWGNYSIPGDNPFLELKEFRPEIWALGLQNPWRCSFDSERPSHFLCADIGQDQYEESHPNSSVESMSASTINMILPVMRYNHSDIKKAEGSASIIGGFFYRSSTDPCMFGRYLYADLLSGDMWAGTENPRGSGTFTSYNLPVSCACNSPIPCSDTVGDSLPALGFTFSFGEDNRKDIFILSSSGLYRVVRPSRCNFSCSKENVTAYTYPQSAASPPPRFTSNGWQLSILINELLFFFPSLLFSALLILSN
ncbi:HIPL1 protein [Quillaja saponaria]|uniref:HIPL1 protein n=1 Tax=Quillaja saponaria TaxID=32244 RepID=A0AAD7PXE1_QUISA|nr:HIPL1 protein [Quillaja saponaria]